MSTQDKTERHLFIADTHFGHSNIHEKFRTQFATQEEHNDTIHNNIMEAGDTQKTLWLLGDTFFKTREFWRLAEYSKVYQKVNTVLGNHCHTGLPRYALQFKNVNVFGVVQKFGLWLTHVPVPDYELYRGKCIHGHLHDKKVITKKEIEDLYGTVSSKVEDDRYFCVSCENIDYKPISLGEIRRIRGWE